MTIDQLRAAALMTAAVTPPAIAVFRHLGRGLRLTERTLLALALAPVALAVPALALALAIPVDRLPRLGGPPIGRWLWPAEFIWIVLALWPTKPWDPAGPEAEPVPERGHGFPAIAAVATAAVAAALIAAVALSGAYVLTSGDAWYHAAAVTEVGRSGVPPQNPGFAGTPFHQPWLFHFGVALLQRTAGISIFEQMSLVNVWAVFVLVLAVAQLAYRAFGRAAAMWAGAIVVLGLNPLGWLFVLLRGRDREFAAGGTDLIARLGSASGAADLLSHRFAPDHVSMLHRFWNGGPLMPAIALAAACAWSAARALERPSRASSLRVLALALAAFAFEPTVASFALAALGAAVVVAAVARGQMARGAGLLSVLALACAAAWGYARVWGLPGVMMEVKPGLDGPALWALLLAVGPWWLIAAPAWGAWRGGSATAVFALAAAMVAAVLAVALVLPAAYSTWLFTIAWVALAPALAAGWVWWSERLRLPGVARLTVFAALVIPTTGLYVLGTAIDASSPGIVVRGNQPETRNLPLATAGESEAYRYISLLDPDAVVIEKPRPTLNEPVAVLGQRRVFCGWLDADLADRLGRERLGRRSARALVEEFRVRRGIQDALFETGILDEQQTQYLVEFSAPLYLLVRHGELPDAVWYGFAARPEWSEQIANQEVRLYEFNREERLTPSGF